MTEQNFQELSAQIALLSSRVEMLSNNLYGSNGHEGDIITIRRLALKSDALTDFHANKLGDHAIRLALQEERWKTVRWLLWGSFGGGLTGVGALVKTLLGG